MDSEKKIPTLMCEDIRSDELYTLDVGEDFCKRSYLRYYLGLSPKWSPRFQCGNKDRIHYCSEHTEKEIEILRVVSSPGGREGMRAFRGRYN